MTGLIEFLLARIADTIAVARAVQAQGVTDGLEPDDPRRPELSLARYVLAECEAKRRIVELSWHHFGDDEWSGGMEQAKREVLELLALPYADHPGYREEWRP